MMSFLKNVRNALTADLPENWRILDRVDQLPELIAESYEQPVAIFKHSVTCGISNMAKMQLAGKWDIPEADLAFYYLDLLTYRPVSNQVAEQLGVWHQSPQLIVISGGRAVFDTSHHGVHLTGLKQVLQDLTAEDV